LNKKYERQLEGFSEEEYRSYDGLNELYEFLDDLIPLNDEDEDSKVGIVPPGEARTRGQKRYVRNPLTSYLYLTSGSPGAREVHGLRVPRRLKRTSWRRLHRRRAVVDQGSERDCQLGRRMMMEIIRCSPTPRKRSWR
jgi:hypothetical protein